MIEKRLIDISRNISSGITPLRSNDEFWTDGTIPWLKTEQLGEKYIFDTNEYITEKALQEANVKLFPENTLSIAMYGEGKTRGNVSILKRPMATNQACCNIELDAEKVSSEYVYYFLKTQYENLRGLSSGIRKNLNTNDIKNFVIRLPENLKTQQSIAAVLSALDKKIALNKQINARLEEMAKTLYDYWFVQFDFPDANGKPYKSSGGDMVFDETLKREIPKGWEVKSLGEVISLERGVTYSKDSICNDENGTGVLRATNISGNNIDLNDLIYISGEVGTQQKLKPFDILIVMSSGSKEHIGKNGVYYFEQDNAFGAFCSKITPKKVFFEFVSIFLQSNNFRNYVKNQCLGTNINNLNNSHILHCPIVRPNDEYIEVFHKQIKLIYEKISCNVKQNHQLTQLRDFLLPMLMNGQVSVAE